MRRVTLRQGFGCTNIEMVKDAGGLHKGRLFSSINRMTELKVWKRLKGK